MRENELHADGEEQRGRGALRWRETENCNCNCNCNCIARGGAEEAEGVEGL